MRTKYSLFLCFFFLIVHNGLAQTNAAIPPPLCTANGNSGFGGAVGLNIFTNGGSVPETATMSFSLSGGGNFDDVLVLYIDAGSSGRSVINATVDDDTDGYTIAITNSNVSGLGSNIYFPVGFEATHAVAIDASFGGLWSIPSSGSVGTGGLTFISSVNSTLTSNTQTTPFDIFIDYADIGLPPNGDFNFVGLYVSHTGATSDEGYGDGIVPGTSGSDDVVFTGVKNFWNCYATLDIENQPDDSFNAFFLDGNLNIQGLHDKVSINVFDISGRLTLNLNEDVYGSLSIPLELQENQIQFIQLKTSSERKILKVIPN